jgi:hypothetical protein
MLLILIKTTDDIEGKKKYLPYVFLPLSYILMRLLFYYIKTDYDLTISLLVMIVVTIFVTYYIKKEKTNKFKTKQRIKLFKGKSKEKDNE